jgi:hypothetical protein
MISSSYFPGNSNLFTTPNPLLKQEGEYLMFAIQEFPLLFQEGVGGGKKTRSLPGQSPSDFTSLTFTPFIT